MCNFRSGVIPHFVPRCSKLMDNTVLLVSFFSIAATMNLFNRLFPMKETYTLFTENPNLPLTKLNICLGVWYSRNAFHFIHRWYWYCHLCKSLTSIRNNVLIRNSLKIYYQRACSYAYCTTCKLCIIFVQCVIHIACAQGRGGKAQLPSSRVFGKQIK